eukprot:250912-Rhodomonas_salina.1
MGWEVRQKMELAVLPPNGKAQDSVQHRSQGGDEGSGDSQGRVVTKSIRACESITRWKLVNLCQSLVFHKQIGHRDRPLHSAVAGWDGGEVWDGRCAGEADAGVPVLASGTSSPSGHATPHFSSRLT